VEIQPETATETVRKNDWFEVYRLDVEILFYILGQMRVVGYVYPVDETKQTNILKLLELNS
jgi:hypothetical protein